jgi:hypothetical protein
MTNPRYAAGRTGASVLLSCAIGGISVLYLLQSASPLRLDHDAFDQLGMAAARADGLPLPSPYLPPGYSIILAALDRAGLGSSFFFVLANCFFLAIGLAAVWQLLGSRSVRFRQWTILLTLLATPVIRSVAIPLPEAAFFGTSLLALWAATTAHTARSGKRELLFACAFVLTAIAASIRLVGIALIPPLLWSWFIGVNNPEAGEKATFRAGPMAVVITLLVAFLVVVLSRTTAFNLYALQAKHVYSQGGLPELAWRMIGTFRSLGEVVVNLPFSRFKGLKHVFLAVGAVAGAGVLLALRRPFNVSISSVYLVSYLVILLIWPHDSSRLWMPIIPLLIAHSAAIIRQYSNSRTVALTVRSYVFWFVLTGLGSLAYTTRISFAGDNFQRLYGNSGGMASPDESERAARPAEVTRYNEEARTLMLRYGGWHVTRRPPRN